MFHWHANWHFLGSKAGFLVATIGRTGPTTCCGGGGNGSAPWRGNRSTSQLRSFTDDDHGRDAGIARGSAVACRPYSSSGCRAKTHRAQVPEVSGSAGSLGGPFHAGRSRVPVTMDLQEYPRIGGGIGEATAPGKPRESCASAPPSRLQPPEQPQDRGGESASGSRCTIPAYQCDRHPRACPGTPGDLGRHQEERTDREL